MKRELLIIGLVGLVASCGSKNKTIKSNPNKKNDKNISTSKREQQQNVSEILSFTYSEYKNGKFCKRTIKSSNLRDYCDALQDEIKARGCGENSRKNEFSKRCSGEFESVANFKMPMVKKTLNCTVKSNDIAKRLRKNLNFRTKFNTHNINQSFEFLKTKNYKFILNSHNSEISIKTIKRNNNKEIFSFNTVLDSKKHMVKFKLNKAKGNLYCEQKKGEVLCSGDIKKVFQSNNTIFQESYILNQDQKILSTKTYKENSTKSLFELLVGPYEQNGYSIILDEVVNKTNTRENNLSVNIDDNFLKFKIKEKSIESTVTCRY